MSTEKQSQPSSVTEELTVLGKKLSAAFQTALHNPQFREVEEEVRDGLQTVVKEVDAALAKARASDAAQQVSGQTAKVVEAARAGKVAQDLRQSLASGLQLLNRQLDDLIERLRAQEAAPAEGETESAEGSGTEED